MITSVYNPRVLAIRKLQAQVKERREQQAFVIEGVRLAEECLLAGWTARQVFHSAELDSRGTAVVDEFSARGAPVEIVAEAVMKAISETETPQGLLVVVERQPTSLPTSPDFALILDGIRDPGNLGTILRTAAAAGVQGVILAPGCADAWSPKVLRAGMGAHFRLPIQSLGWQEVRSWLKNGSTELRIYLADSKEGLVYTQADFHSPLVLIIGGEAAGAGSESTGLADVKVHIPMPGQSESLNAAVAASILLFEVVRQRAS